MDHPFNLTKCKKLSLRRRTIAKGEPTTYYHTYYEPKGLNKHQRRIAIDSFKHPKTFDEKRTSDKMVEYAINEFLKVHDINEFDTILGIPSSSGIVKKIIDKFVLNGFKGPVFHRGFKKTRIRNVKLKKYILDRELSLKTKEKVPQSFQRTRKLHYDKVSKASLFPTRFRRYVEGFLNFDFYKLTKTNKDLLKKNVLVVDDTFGEGLTMCEAVKLLKPYTNKITGFTVMKDISR